jgi:hypothetical protein
MSANEEALSATASVASRGLRCSITRFNDQRRRIPSPEFENHPSLLSQTRLIDSLTAETERTGSDKTFADRAKALIERDKALLKRVAKCSVAAAQCWFCSHAITQSSTAEAGLAGEPDTNTNPPLGYSAGLPQLVAVGSTMVVP